MLVYKTCYDFCTKIYRCSGFTDKFHLQFILPKLNGIENKIPDSKNEANRDECKFPWTSSRINYFQDF